MNELPPKVMDEITESIYQGNKLKAVKTYKEARGTSLLEAKKFIEDLTAELEAASPEQFATRSTTGCAGLLLLFFSSVAICVALVIPIARQAV